MNQVVDANKRLLVVLREYFYISAIATEDSITTKTTHKLLVTPKKVFNR
jgi:hypothetical protein